MLVKRRCDCKVAAAFSPGPYSRATSPAAPYALQGFKSLQSFSSNFQSKSHFYLEVSVVMCVFESREQGSHNGRFCCIQELFVLVFPTVLLWCDFVCFSITWVLSLWSPQGKCLFSCVAFVLLCFPSWLIFFLCRGATGWTRTCFIDNLLTLDIVSIRRTQMLLK